MPQYQRDDSASLSTLSNLRLDGRTPADTGRLVAVAASRRPRLSWQIPAGDRFRNPLSREVRVTSDDADPRDDAADFVFREESNDLNPYTIVTEPLASHSRFRWSARLRDSQGTWSSWAAPALIETGPLEFDDWQAKWVSHPPLSVLRATADFRSSVLKARLHVTAQGLVRASVNSHDVNASETDSTRTDFARALYRSYDVTDLCRVGENTLDLTLAGGGWEASGREPRVLAELRAELDDGTIVRFGTDERMLAAPSEIVTAEPFYLEVHDPAAAGEFTAALSLVVLEPADAPATLEQPPRDVRPDPTPAIHHVTTIEPRPLSRVGDARVFDVGVNIAGRTRLTLHDAVPAGTVVRVVHGEHLDAAGRLDTTNLTMPYDHGRVRQAVEYTATGAADQVCEPWFAYHGFRYIEVVGLPETSSASLVAFTHHTDLREISSLTTDNDQVNRLIERAKRTLLNNVHGIPEDCPTREQSGWTGDTASVTEFEYSAFDMEAFFGKWLGDLRSSQQPDGAIPAIAPNIRETPMPSDPVWGSALQRVLINHWYHYGDRRVLAENLPALRRWADFQLACRDDDGIVSLAPISYGHDWLALQQTPPPIHHTAATIDCLSVLAELEEAKGDTESAERRRTEAAELRSAARRAFFDETTGTFGNGSQGSLANALEAGILTGAEAVEAAARIEAEVRARGNRVSTGFACTRTLVRALAHSGRSQVLFDVLQQSVEPGVGAMIDHGPGTLWECWWIDPNNTGTGSLDHVGLGGPFASWAWQHLAGVRPVAAGYAEFEVAPHFVDGIDHLTLSTQTTRGRVGVEYQRDGDVLRLDLTVPPGAVAVVRLPGRSDERLGSGTHAIESTWPTTMPSHPAVDATPWRPPSRAPLSGDVSGSFDLLERAIIGNTISLSEGTIELLADGINCMPIPHAQLPGTIVKVIGSDDPTRAAPTIRLDFPDALDLSDAIFAYAELDLCLPNAVVPMETLIILHGRDGSRREQTARIWPAGWNRVSVDVASWAGRWAVVAIEAGLRYSSPPSPHADSPHAQPASFHLGQVGYSRTRRTW